MGNPVCPFRRRVATIPPAPATPPKPATVLKLLPSGNYNYGSDVPRLGRPIRFLVHHVAVGNGSLYGWFKSSGLSTNYWVAKDGTIEQYVPDAYAAYGQGIISAGSDFPTEYPGRGDLYNCMALSVEREGYEYEEPTTRQWASMIALDRWLAWEHKIPIDRQHFVGHYRSDWRNRANCPRIVPEPYMEKIIAAVVR